MGPIVGVILCLGYILGLLFTKIAWGGYVVLGMGAIAAAIVPRYWRTAPKSRIWLAAGSVGLLAALYFQLRLPQPQASDISHLVTDGTVQEWVVKGRVMSLPHLTRSQKAQFWLDVQQMIPGQGRSVTGKLYVTVPLLQATGLHPGQIVNVAGSPYLPEPAANPGAFDFKEYLRQESSFAGLRGKQVELLEQSAEWGWWIVQQRIVRSQMMWLGSPVGPLVSAMVLGNKPVDLPYDIKDSFVHVGLAAALAASGFQTSLILGIVLALTRRCSERVQGVVGTIALLGFVGLTGLQPSVLRAAVMGFGGLVALMMRRQTKPLGALLVTATLLLLWNPQWIWDLGFQLSFLATMGLLVTVAPLTKWLDWMPSAIAPLVAVPIAAYLWTLPLQLYAFGVLSPYSIPVNIITTPLISVISIGGVASALAALVWLPAGSAIAWLLYYPTQALITIVDTVAQLPGNTYATGTISPLITIALYSGIVLVWRHRWWQRRWWIALFLGVVLTLLPIWQVKATLFRATVLATSKQPVMVIQDAGRTVLVNSGDAATASFTVLPFLQQQGVNHLDRAILADKKSVGIQGGWSQIIDRIPARLVYSTFSTRNQPTTPAARQEYLPLPLEQNLKVGSTQVKLISAEPAIVEFQMSGQTWLRLDTMPLDQQLKWAQSGHLHPVQVLWWSGKPLHPALLAVLKPETAIASTKTISSTTVGQLRKHTAHLYWTGKDGAIQWTPKDGFKTTLESDDNAPSRL